MRYLNKIVFINSAHIRFAEVAMDGNVHFTGTQGVGKTTLLRALLFFYNCRKDRLGIRVQNQSTFDDYYVPTTSSYIIYEVARGDGEQPFSIILFRHHNRAAFRFVDAPFAKEWFIDDHGLVASDHLTVRQRIQSQGIDLSGIIDRYGTYLDILYGNSNAHLSKDLLKYWLLRSRQYQNIPRIIQNVFLNERVDAGFIKNVIINSITNEDEDVSVNLDFFRSKLSHFTDELNDIKLWSATNRQGVNLTRRDADHIIEVSDTIKSSRHGLREQCAMLNYAMAKAEQDIPLIQNRITGKVGKVKELDDKISELSQKYEKDKKVLTGKIAILANDISRATERRKKYQQLGIDQIIARSEKQPALRLELSQKERLERELTDSHRSIAEKYTALKERLELDRRQYLQTLAENKNTAVGDFNARHLARVDRRSKLEAEVRVKFAGQLNDIDETLSNTRELLHEQRELRTQASYSSPMKEEIERCGQILAELENKTRKLGEAQLKAENKLNAARDKFELDCLRIGSETDLRINDLENQINRLDIRRNDEKALLEKARGSLCEWLDTNVEGWEQSIGKIVDEKEVLYAQNLSPHLTDTGTDTLFGISIDLESIDKEVRTPSMIKEAIGNLDREIQALGHEEIKVREERDSRIEEIGKHSRTRIKELQTELNDIAKELDTVGKQQKEAKLWLEELKEEEKLRLAEILRQFDEHIQELNLRCETLKEERKALGDRQEKELRRVAKTISDAEEDDRLQHDRYLKSIDEDRTKYSTACDAKLAQLAKDEETELTHSGADIRMLEAVRNEIAAVRAELDRIDRERVTIVEYNKDRRELIDKEADMRRDKKALEEDLAGLDHKYTERRGRLELKRKEESNALADLRVRYDKAVESKREAEEFIQSAACPPELKEVGAVPTTLPSAAIIMTIKDLTVTILRASEELKRSVNEFQSRFSPNNTFKFPTSLLSLDDYHRYADSVEDFVKNDKIKEFQQVTSNLYRDILSRVASDFNILLERESDIRRIIKDINYDFEKKTFAGVIRKIELRLERSSTPIITQLENITQFWNANQNDLGEINLFSTDENADVNRESIKYLKALTTALTNSAELKRLPLEQTFALQFQITENDNTTPWVENIKAVGSEGTDILVKAIINILLISVFKKRAGRAGDFRLHCMMDEIGRLADENIQGILTFANQRGIFVVNSSPKAHRPLSYRRLYMLSKDAKANTVVQPILSTREAEML